MENNEKYKVVNDKPFDGAVFVLNRPARSQLVKAGSFVYLTEDEIAYNISMNTIFQSGLLRVDRSTNVLEENGILVDDNPNFATKEEIAKILGGPQKKLEAWLKSVHEDHVLNLVFETAKEMNLSASKLKLLQAKMPGKEFLEN